MSEVRDNPGQFVVRRVGELHGTIDVPGAKNSVLKLMAATILADGTYELSNVPNIVDVEIMGELLAAIGIRTEVPAPGRLRLVNDGDLLPVAPYDQVERIRASINVLGPLLTRCGRVRLSMPGGDDFGARPIDMHVAGLEAMGAEFKFGHGELEATADRLHGAAITFGFPSVGATENIVTAAVFADGVTTIENAAGNPRSSTSARCSSRWAPTSRVSARHGWWCAASSRGRCGPPITARCPTASRRPPTSPPSPSPAAS